MPRPVQLTKASPAEFARLLAEAAKLGASDAKEGRAPRTAAEVVGALPVTAWKVGHAHGLHAAYAAGRYHAACAPAVFPFFAEEPG